jgi:hypothetical protein
LTRPRRPRVTAEEQAQGSPMRQAAAVWLTFLAITLGGLTMTQVQAEDQAGFQTVLAAPGRSPAIPEAMDVYGWLVGSWDLAVLRYRGTYVAARGLKGEVHFGWVLRGASHSGRVDHASAFGPHRERRGDAEHVWHHLSHVGPGDPGLAHHLEESAGGHYEEHVGRWIGPDIVQVGARPNGTPTRWTFTEITPKSFRWLGEALEPDGKTWKLEGEFRATRAR